MDPKRISGPVKAAILIHALGRPLADVLLQQLSSSEKEIIGKYHPKSSRKSPKNLPLSPGGISQRQVDPLRSEGLRQKRLSKIRMPKTAVSGPSAP